MIAAVLSKLFADDEPVVAKLNAMASHTMHNWNKIEVGTVRPAGELAG